MTLPTAVTTTTTAAAAAAAAAGCDAATTTTTNDCYLSKYCPCQLTQSIAESLFGVCPEEDEETYMEFDEKTAVDMELDEESSIITAVDERQQQQECRCPVTKAAHLLERIAQYPPQLLQDLQLPFPLRSKTARAPELPLYHQQIN